MNKFLDESATPLTTLWLNSSWLANLFSLKTGEIVGKLYDAFHDQYLNPDKEHSLASSTNFV